MCECGCRAAECSGRNDPARLQQSRSARCRAGVCTQLRRAERKCDRHMCGHRALCQQPRHPAVSAGASGVGQTMRVNWPRCSSSRPLPPRPVTSYLAVLMVCSAPRVVSTVSRSRSPRRGDEAEHAVLVAELDQDDALAGAGQEVHLVGLAEQPARLRRWRQSGFRRRSTVATPTTSAPFGRPRVPPPGARARLDERLEAEAQRVAVARDGDRVHRRRLSPSFFGGLMSPIDPRVEAERRRRSSRRPSA